MTPRIENIANLINRLFVAAGKDGEHQELLTEAGNALAQMDGDWSALKRLFEQSEKRWR